MAYRYNVFTGTLDFVNESSGSTENPYTQSFNSTTDWGSASGGYYTITVLSATHARGTSPTVSVYESTGSDNFLVFVDRLNITTTGQVEIRVPDTPDLRFAGKIVITR